MKSKASYFSVSIPLIKEDFRRFWVIPVLSFLVYFFSFTFQVLMSYSHLNDMQSYIVNALLNYNMPIMFAHGIFPVIAAVIVFRYLQSSSSVTVMHAMPFTRNKLFNSHMLAGLFLTLIPLLLNGLILLAISKPIVNIYSQASVFERPEILMWLGQSVVIICFVYAISVFAGIVTGNALMHLAMAGMFNFVVPGMCMLLAVYFQQFIFGFSISDSFYEVCANMTPYLSVINSGAMDNYVRTMIYIAVALVLLAVSSFLYGKRKLEKSGDSLVFNFMQPLICYIITFSGMSLVGFYFSSFWNKGQNIIYFGFAAGILIFFIIGQMMVKKTPRIFNFKSLRDFCIFAVLACLLLITITFDITGYEKRIPPVDGVTSVNISTSLFGEEINYYVGNADEPWNLKDPKNIEAVARFHKSIVDNKDQLFRVNERPYGTTWMYLSYDSGNKKTLDRTYNNVDRKFIVGNEDLKEIFESKEFKEIASIKNSGIAKVNSVDVYPHTGSNGLNPNYIEQGDIPQLITCLDQDFKDATYEEMVGYDRPYVALNIYYSYPVKNQKELGTMNVNKNVPKSYTRTVNFLKSKGYGIGMVSTAEDIDYIEIYKSEVGIDDYTTLAEPKVIKDKGQIAEILATSKTRQIDKNSYYYGQIYYKDSRQENFYYELDVAPSLITELFK